MAVNELSSWPELQNRSMTRGSQLKNSADECGRAVGRRLTGGNEFFTEAVTAFHHAVNARLPPNHNVLDEAKLLGQFAALKTEFGLTDRYRIEGWRAGRE
jgi:hypothetical protein